MHRTIPSTSLRDNQTTSMSKTSLNNVLITVQTTEFATLSSDNASNTINILK